MYTDDAHALFDLAASDYDASFSNTFSGKEQRERIHRYLIKNRLATEKTRALELNGGTGSDALFLHACGCRVTFTDASEAMLAEATKKFSAASVELPSFHLDMRKLPPAQPSYDLIFSNFSGWNCLDREELLSLFNWMHASLVPGGRVVAVLFGTRPLMERLYFALRGDMKGFNRRKNTKGIFTSDGINTPTYYYSPNALKMLCARQFLPVAQVPVGLFIPPGFLSERMQKYRRMLCTFEDMFQGFSFLSNSADHYLIDLVRKS